VFALCLETSHAKGMGHFFRILNLARALHRAGQSTIIIVNDFAPAMSLLRATGLRFVTADLNDHESAWEQRVIRDEGIRVWVDDRLDTDAYHSKCVKRCGIPLATFDDRGYGAADADLNVAALACDDAESLPGRRVLRGFKYLILDPEIARYRRLRARRGRLLVTLGGSDTHGVTMKVVKCLREARRSATVVVGPGFGSHEALLDMAGDGIEIRQGVPSLIAEFASFDLAITGGGITPFEANASGLPCVIVANEQFEVPVAQGLARLGGAVFAGYHEQLDESVLVRDLPLEAMSRAGMVHLDLEGANRVVRELMSL
jgi:spore coat polysaccharide biosynthesis predicted glycosyltransferase SpsG